ncbi:MAG TPA: MlaD family protein [Alphaproteobacteria bacterium]|nr:MlaD family protein [Alphaproteobacteria bacterium]
MAAERPAVVGGFVLGAAALAVAAILFFGGTRFFERTTRAVVLFDGSVAGLDVGAPVTFRGFRIGSVRDIVVHLSPEGWARTYVYIEGQPDKLVIELGGSTKEPRIEDLVAKGLRAQLALQSFVTAQLRVDLNFEPATPATLAPVDTHGVPQIPAVQSGLERLQTTITELPLQDLAQAALRTLASGQRLMDDLDAKLDPLAGKLDRLLESATVTAETGTEAVARLQADGSRTLFAAQRFLEEAQRQVDDRGAEIRTALESANRAARKVEALADSADSLIAQRSRFRGDLEAAARDLAASSASLRGFAQQIERNPGTLVRGTGE